MSTKNVSQTTTALLTTSRNYLFFQSDFLKMRQTCNCRIDVRGAPEWFQYFLCGVKGILEVLPADTKVRGFSVAVSGTIPESAGLSSSSALVSAAAVATAVVHKVSGAGFLKRVHAAQWVVKTGSRYFMQLGFSFPYPRRGSRIYARPVNATLGPREAEWTRLSPSWRPRVSNIP